MMIKVKAMMMAWYNDSQLRVEGGHAAKSVLLSWQPWLLQRSSTLRYPLNTVQATIHKALHLIIYLLPFFFCDMQYALI